MPTVFGQIGAYAASGNLVQFSIALILVIAMYIALRKFIGLTKISKSTNYGLKKTD